MPPFRNRVSQRRAVRWCVCQQYRDALQSEFRDALQNELEGQPIVPMIPAKQILHSAFHHHDTRRKQKHFHPAQLPLEPVPTGGNGP